MSHRNNQHIALRDNDLQPDGTDGIGTIGVTNPRITDREVRAMQNDLSSDTDAALVHRLANQLASIRSAAEILRDVPELAPDERRRFAAVVLEGEQNLETLLPRLARYQA